MQQWWGGQSQAGQWWGNQMQGPSAAGTWWGGQTQDKGDAAEQWSQDVTQFVQNMLPCPDMQPLKCSDGSAPTPSFGGPRKSHQGSGISVDLAKQFVRSSDKA